MAQLFVGQLSFEKFYPEDFVQLFRPYGTVIAHELYFRKGNGFITYSTTDEADAAILALHGKYVAQGRSQPLQVMYSKGTKHISLFGLQHRKQCLAIQDEIKKQQEQRYLLHEDVRSYSQPMYGAAPNTSGLRYAYPDLPQYTPQRANWSLPSTIPSTVSSMVNLVPTGQSPMWATVQAGNTFLPSSGFSAAAPLQGYTVPTSGFAPPRTQSTSVATSSNPVYYVVMPGMSGATPQIAPLMSASEVATGVAPSASWAQHKAALGNSQPLSEDSASRA